MAKNIFLQGALDRKKVTRNFKADCLDLSIDEFICCISEFCVPAKYGNMFQKKVCYDSEYGIAPIPAAIDRGDCRIGNSKFAELKISYISEKGSYGIRNIRPWQDFDYYILCFVDENFKARFYCVNKKVITNNGSIKLNYQNGTIASNINNTNVNLSANIKHEDLTWHFKKTNLLKGTKYKHLLKFIGEIAGVEKNADAPIARGIYAPTSILSFEYNGMIITGKNNKEAMLNLAKKIGGKRLDGVMWKSQFSREKRPLHEPIGSGYYFNPKFSYRDTVKVVKTLNEKANLNIEILNNN